jgi:DNA-binding LacI/PurR family transcriptional regulator
MYKNRKVTIKQVAKAAGVSTQTVSRVLNDHPDVADQTRQHVQGVIEEMGYRPSALARSLIHQRSFMIGVVTAGLKYTGPSRTLSGIADQIEKMGYSLILKEVQHFNVNNIDSILNELLARQIDGLLWAVPEVEDNYTWLQNRLPEIPVPIVSLHEQIHRGVTAVLFDNFHGGYLATQHLFDTGRQRIAHISGPLDWWASKERKRGWQQALNAAGIQITSLHHVEGDWSGASGEKTMSQLLIQYPDLDAVFIANDHMALGAMLHLHQVGKRVPEDIAVVGYDGLPETKHYSPPLTTIEINQRECGSIAVKRLIECIENYKEHQPVDPKTVVLQPRLIVRSSSGVDA